jgi:hypothetical protein
LYRGRRGDWTWVSQLAMTDTIEQDSAYPSDPYSGILNLLIALDITLSNHVSQVRLSRSSCPKTRYLLLEVGGTEGKKCVGIEWIK